MRKFAFKPFKGDKTVPTDDPTESRNPVQKRREQVRRAQRTHRERKETYIASLESEVVRLRAKEARLESKIKTLYAENSILKKGLTQQDVPLPTETEAADETISLTVFQENSITKKGSWRKQISVTQPHKPITNFSQPVSPPSSKSSSRSSTSPTPTPPPTTHLGALDPDIIGMDFVLTLESPCLSHTDISPIPTPHHPRTSSLPTTTGHALTLSACLLHTHPSPPGHRQYSQTPWRAPRSSLSHVLSISSNVPLADGEVTPVQAWEYVRQHAAFSGLEVGRWEMLKEKLVGAVRCYGYGGVIERKVLENVVFEAFVVGRIF
ncbi:hypothetical protein COCVIDRAFT_97594 [Bipolaris victoriae FI3]|uniref:BZIP domain-containing protein n=1 Tax=Bipolaris victoriae (strain FI3) TaxID=930091 RepID=W7EUG7_BIPV3|nr:hypothetical protein COCVIDRAFT_97594 [Bipolaris victoriae FI3]